MRGRMNVHGTATAASIWNTGVIGAAVAEGSYEISILLSVLNLITLHLLVPWKTTSTRPSTNESSKESNHR